MQVAAGRALHYAEQLRRKGRQVTISLPSATTARDILPTRPGETRPRTSHRAIASNNSRKLQQLGSQVTISVDTANTPQRLQHEAEAAARSGDLRAQVRVPGRAVYMPAHSGMSLGRGIQGTNLPPTSYPPQPPSHPPQHPSPPSVTLGRGFSLCRCVEHAPH